MISNHLFDQADGLLVADRPGPPRQADLKRAVSTAYYGLFHVVLTQTADHFIGRSERSQPLYVSAYRSVAHAQILKICKLVTTGRLFVVRTSTAPERLFGPAFVEFAHAFIGLQEARHSADYNPAYRLTTAAASGHATDARAAAARFLNSPNDERVTFVNAVVFGAPT